MNIILASKSKRRDFLLKRLIKKFTVVDSNFDENTINIKNPEKYCQKLANLKALSVAKKPIRPTLASSRIVDVGQN